MLFNDSPNHFDQKALEDNSRHNNLMFLTFSNVQSTAVNMIQVIQVQRTYDC